MIALFVQPSVNWVLFLGGVVLFLEPLMCLIFLRKFKKLPVW